jgi:hypothetical protein
VSALTAADAVPPMLTAMATENAAKMETILHRENFKLHLAFELIWSYDRCIYGAVIKKNNWWISACRHLDLYSRASPMSPDAGTDKA